jgi:hypothetical protein
MARDMLPTAQVVGVAGLVLVARGVGINGKTKRATVPLVGLGRCRLRRKD